MRETVVQLEILQQHVNSPVPIVLHLVESQAKEVSWKFPKHHRPLSRLMVALYNMIIKPYC